MRERLQEYTSQKTYKTCRRKAFLKPLIIIIDLNIRKRHPFSDRMSQQHKCASLPYTIYQVKESLIKTPMCFYLETDKFILKFLQKNKHDKIEIKVLKDRNNEGWLSLLRLLICTNKVSITKKVWYQHMNSQKSITKQKVQKWIQAYGNLVCHFLK